MYNEFSLIKTITERMASHNNKHPALVIPPGDDAALLSRIIRPVISTDCHRENIHFRLDWQTPAEIGYKAATVTLSDLAASYARPISLFINLGLPRDTDDSLVMELYDGISEALTLYPCAIGGGNIASALELSLDLFAIGEGSGDIFPLRSNALAGEGLYSTGPLGLAKAGLNALEKRLAGFDLLIERFKRPSARFDSAEVLRKNHVTCVMDVSDGLSGDAAHIAEASGLSIRFTLEQGMLSPELIRYCDETGESALDTALSGGEDYELLFTCSSGVYERIHQELPQSLKVGECLPYSGRFIMNPPLTGSYVHGY